MAILSIDREYASWLQREWLLNPQVHDFIFRVARFCHLKGANQQETFQLLRACADLHPDRRVPDDEIWRQIRSAWDDNRVDGPRRPKWPPPDPVRRDRAFRSSVTMQSWNAISRPIPTTQQVLQTCFHQYEYVCLGVDASHPVCRLLADWLTDPSLNLYAYITPNPMRGLVGLTQRSWNSLPDDPYLEDEWSPRTDLNVAMRRFLSVEFDHDSLDAQAALIASIVQEGGIRPWVITWSGAKSLHSLFYIGDLSPASVQHWFGIATAHGADPRLWTPSQFCRLPSGYNHKTQQRQAILYWSRP